MKINDKTKIIVSNLSKKIKKSESEIFKDAINIFAYIYGQYELGIEVIFRDKDNKEDERKLDFNDFLD